MNTRVLIVFLDGVGIGSNDAGTNPFLRAQLPAWERLRAAGTFIGLDATLGVPGLPQSGTGQAALFTGTNAAQQFGRHFGPWVPTALREQLARENVLSRAKQSGFDVAFANAYPEELFQPRAATSRMARDPLRAGPPIVALGAGVLTRHTDALQRGDAVASEITNNGWRDQLKRTEVPEITPREAGRNLARIAARHDVTLFAHYSTDYVGHRGHMEEAVAALEKVDAFLDGIAAEATADTLLVVVSDHGNLEDINAGHTLNPAIGLFWGAQHQHFRNARELPDVAPLILSVLANP